MNQETRNQLMKMDDDQRATALIKFSELYGNIETYLNDTIGYNIQEIIGPYGDCFDEVQTFHNSDTYDFIYEAIGTLLNGKALCFECEKLKNYDQFETRIVGGKGPLADHRDDVTYYTDQVLCNSGICLECESD